MARQPWTSASASVRVAAKVRVNRTTKGSGGHAASWWMDEMTQHSEVGVSVKLSAKVAT